MPEAGIAYCPKCASSDTRYAGLGVYICEKCGTRWEILSADPREPKK